MYVEVRKWVKLCVKMVTINIKFSRKYAGNVFFFRTKNNQVINPNYSDAFQSLRSEKDIEVLKKALGHVMKDELFCNCGFNLPKSFQVDSNIDYLLTITKSLAPILYRNCLQSLN